MNKLNVTLRFYMPTKPMMLTWGGVGLRRTSRNHGSLDASCCPRRVLGVRRDNEAKQNYRESCTGIILSRLLVWAAGAARQGTYALPTPSSQEPSSSSLEHGPYRISPATRDGAAYPAPSLCDVPFKLNSHQPGHLSFSTDIFQAH
jgi:hypothetical protein